VSKETLTAGGYTVWQKYPDMRDRMQNARAKSKGVREAARKTKGHVYE